MPSIKRIMVALTVASAGVIAAAPVATAKPGPKLSVKVAPAAPTLKTPITVILKAPKVKPGVTSYGVDLSTGEQSGGLQCVSSIPTTSLRATRGHGFTVTLKPKQGGPGSSTWCPGKARVEIRRYGPGKLYSGVLVRRDFTIGLGRGEATPPESFVPVKVTVLGGSTLTASAAGRPDRSSQLTGVLRGKIPGRFKPNTDVQVQELTGSLTPLSSSLAKAVFPPDPLCPDATPPATFDALPASQLALLASGDATTSLVLNGAPSQLFGCGPAGALAGTTTLPLSGHVGPNGLLSLKQSGAVTGIALPGGSAGGLAASLVLNVDLSGKG